MRRDVSASIVLYKTPASVALNALKSVLPEVDKVWVIDHSPHPSLSLPIPDNPKIVYISRPNRGYGAGNNFALKESAAESYKYHLVINPDVYWNGPVVEKLSLYLDSNPEVALIMPKVLYPDGRFQLQAKQLPTMADFILPRLGLGKKSREQYQQSIENIKEPVDIPFLSGCFMLLRNSALKHVGNFDERFFMYCEDLDLSRRLSHSFRTVYYPNVGIYHHLSRSSTRSPRLFIIHFISVLRYLIKYRFH